MHYFERNPNNTLEWIEYFKNEAIYRFVQITYDNYDNVIIYNSERSQYVQMNSTMVVMVVGQIEALDDPDYTFVGEWKIQTSIESRNYECSVFFKI